MTLPTGQIAFSDVNSEVGAAWNAQRDMGWIRDNTKGNPANLNAIKGYAWYQRNADGNCNNGNCNCNCNCGNIQCNNCSLSNINCANCDARAWLQSNCNCACTYNCGQITNHTYNCDCQCY